MTAPRYLPRTAGARLLDAAVALGIVVLVGGVAAFLWSASPPACAGSPTYTAAVARHVAERAQLQRQIDGQQTTIDRMRARYDAAVRRRLP